MYIYIYIFCFYTTSLYFFPHLLCFFHDISRLRTESPVWHWRIHKCSGRSPRAPFVRHDFLGGGCPERDLKMVVEEWRLWTGPWEGWWDDDWGYGYWVCWLVSAKGYFLAWQLQVKMVFCSWLFFWQVGKFQIWTFLEYLKVTEVSQGKLFQTFHLICGIWFWYGNWSTQKIPDKQHQTARKVLGKFPRPHTVPAGCPRPSQLQNLSRSVKSQPSSASRNDSTKKHKQCLWRKGEIQLNTNGRYQVHGRNMVEKITGWWFQSSFIFTPTWGNDAIWLIFFNWVETIYRQLWSFNDPECCSGVSRRVFFSCDGWGRTWVLLASWLRRTALWWYSTSSEVFFTFQGKNDLFGRKEVVLPETFRIDERGGRSGSLICWDDILDTFA